MDTFGLLLHGLGLALTPHNLLYALIGVTLGTAVGVLPGIGPALTVAHAMQTFGMYVVDNSGRPKIYFEDDLTAQWQDVIAARTVSAIPVDAIRAVPPPPEPPGPAGSTSTAPAP